MLPSSLDTESMVDVMADADVRVAVTPYEMIGGTEAVRRIVDCFYDLMDEKPDFAELRALHAADLAPMRESLTGFLTAWLGGPRDWFANNPGKCVMSVHGAVAVTPQTARQWCDAMRIAIADYVVDETLAARMADTLEGMALGMVRR
jgi:hemoglobin